MNGLPLTSAIHSDWIAGAAGKGGKTTGDFKKGCDAVTARLAG
jgi:hypothetical protein